MGDSRNNTVKMKHKIKRGKDVPQDDMKNLLTSSVKKKRPHDKVLEEYIKNAPTIGGFTLEELAETKHLSFGNVCPTCGRPYGRGTTKN